MLLFHQFLQLCILAVRYNAMTTPRNMHVCVSRSSHVLDDAQSSYVYGKKSKGSAGVCQTLLNLHFPLFVTAMSSCLHCQGPSQAGVKDLAISALYANSFFMAMLWGSTYVHAECEQKLVLSGM